MAAADKLVAIAILVAHLVGFADSALVVDTIKSERQAPKSCDDLLTGANAFFLQGESDSVAKEIETFFGTNGRFLFRYNETCRVNVYRLYALMSYQLRRDLNASVMYYRNLFFIRPDAELWDLGMIYPIVAQSYFDSLKRFWVPRRDPIVFGDSAIWVNQWTPGIKMNVAQRASALNRKVSLTDRKAALYHRARWLYAQSGITREFEDLYYLIHKEPDEVFWLLKADIRLRLGYGPTEVRRDLKGFTLQSSLVDIGDLNSWYRRIDNRCRKLEEVGYVPRVTKTRIDSIGIIEFHVDRRYR